MLMRQQAVSFEEFGAFYASHKDRCLRATVASGVDPGRAEDAVAEAFARAWARWRTVRATRSPAAWVVRTAVNADISWWRKRRAEVGPPEDGPPENARGDHLDLDCAPTSPPKELAHEPRSRRRTALRQRPHPRPPARRHPRPG